MQFSFRATPIGISINFGVLGKLWATQNCILPLYFTKWFDPQQWEEE
jgi:hypothetical protein